MNGFAAELLNWMAVVIVVLFMLFAILELRSRGFGMPTSLTGGRMSVNFGTAILTAAAELLIPFGTLSAALFASQNDVGLFNIVAAPVGLILVTALLGRTLIVYGLHRAFHKIPLLWRFHRIHHSDPYFDISLGVRQHPLILLVSLPVYIFGVIALGLPVWAVILVDILMLAAAFWEHVDAPLPQRLARALGFVLITPNSHHIHHSSRQRQTDSNFGSGLVIWDRLFGTYLEPEQETVERIGLGDADDLIADSLWKQLYLPFKPRG
ncbi:sterol desaturase family protein [Parasphingorhabdus sp.]|uniref:sterol desaturase family protein n=1 Tax=Parasphingorhabdus sp. TaxID=2709688 RepID=UPI003D2A1055